LERPEPAEQARTNELDADERRRMLGLEEGVFGLQAPGAGWGGSHRHPFGGWPEPAP
jgi:hypothetical protein